MSSEPKRRKIDGEPPPSGSIESSVSAIRWAYNLPFSDSHVWYNTGAFKAPPKKKATDALPSDVELAAQTSNSNLKITQARNFAVAQAQQDGCTGNFRIFDSPFGNFLVPVIPTRAELGG